MLRASQRFFFKFSERLRDAIECKERSTLISVRLTPEFRTHYRTKLGTNPPAGPSHWLSPQQCRDGSAQLRPDRSGNPICCMGAMIKRRLLPRLRLQDRFTAPQDLHSAHSGTQTQVPRLERFSYGVNLTPVGGDACRGRSSLLQPERPPRSAVSITHTGKGYEKTSENLQ